MILKQIAFLLLLGLADALHLNRIVEYLMEDKRKGKQCPQWRALNKTMD